MKIRNEINQILRDWKYEILTTDEAIDFILRLFSVIDQSEQLVCERCKLLEFMIDNGLDWDDMKNDNL